MNRLKKDLQQYEENIELRKHLIKEQVAQLKSTATEVVTSPLGLGAIFLLSFFLVSPRYRKIFSPIFSLKKVLFINFLSSSKLMKVGVANVLNYIRKHVSETSKNL